MAIRYLILSLTNRCNLACRYCYNGEPGTIEEMPTAVILRAVEIAARESDGFHLQLTGGEPTLVPELILAAVTLANKTGRCRGFGLQTNGTCLTKELATLFRTYGIQVGISLDGPPRVQQHQRGMATETFKGMQLLESEHIPFNVTTVVTQYNAVLLDRLVLTLAGFACARGIGLDLLVNKGRARQSAAAAPAPSSVLKEGLQRMLNLLNRINAARTQPIRLRERETLMAAAAGKVSVFCHACRGESMAVTPSGLIFPCGQTLGDPFFTAGTVREPKLNRLTKLKRVHPNLSRCQECSLKRICPGDCPSRLYYNQDRTPSPICDLYQALWEFEVLLSSV